MPGRGMKGTGQAMPPVVPMAANPMRPQAPSAALSGLNRAVAARAGGMRPGMMDPRARSQIMGRVLRGGNV
jgi:hypothetical protein